MKMFIRAESGRALVYALLVIPLLLALVVFMMYGKTVRKSMKCEGCGKAYQSESHRTSIFSSEKDEEKTSGFCNFGCAMGSGLKQMSDEMAKGMVDAFDNMAQEMFDNANWEQTLENRSSVTPDNATEIK